MKDRGILGTFRGRKTAENLAREKADLGWSSQLLIYRPNGSIETSLFIPKITGSEPQMRS